MAGNHGRFCRDSPGSSRNAGNKSNNRKYRAVPHSLLHFSDIAADIISQIIPADIPLSAVKAVKTILFSDSKQAPSGCLFFYCKTKKIKICKKTY